MGRRSGIPTNGFVIEGTHRAYVFRLGEFADAYTMARLRRPPEIAID
jgi:RimJ/RimL family protein N-acetyltransferase